MRPFTDELGKVPDGESQRIIRGPVIITAVQRGRTLEVWHGPPWAAESVLVTRLDGDTFKGRFPVTMYQSIVAPEKDRRRCRIEGVELDASEAYQRDVNDEEEAAWAFLARDLPPLRSRSY